MGDSGDCNPNDESKKEKKPPMTDEERMKLTEKLDADLDSFISGLEKRSYDEGWPEDRWQEEMEKHPFFMSKAPEPGEELSPLMQGLQNLKYDSSENTPEELAVTYKEDGNFNFKCKKYRLAIISYTEGIKQKCSDIELNAQLYNNRAASHFFIKNYRSCLNDCLAALKLKPDYTKTICRAAHCYFHLKDFQKCIEYCDMVLKNDPKHEIINLRKDASAKKVVHERDDRKKRFQERKLKENHKKLLKAIEERGIKILGHENEELSLSLLEPNFPEILDSRVYLDKDHLIWPVLLLYPEYKMSEFIQEFHEDSYFIDHLEEMFSSTPSWDEESKYTPEKIVIYYEDVNGRPHIVSKESTLAEIIAQENFRVDQGTPAFIVLVKNSKAEKQFLSNS